MPKRRRATYPICDICGCPLEPQHHLPRTCKRHSQAVALRASGMTLAQVGQELGVSRQRVHQILSRIAKKKNRFSGSVMALAKSYGLHETEIRGLIKRGMTGSEFLKAMEAARKK